MKQLHRITRRNESHWVEVGSLFSCNTSAAELNRSFY